MSPPQLKIYKRSLQPPALQSASEPSDASTSFTSSEESSDEPHRRQVLPGFCGGVPGAGPRAGSSEGGDGGGGRGGVSELVPFSLSEIACVPSETVSEITGSAASSPFRCVLVTVVVMVMVAVVVVWWSSYLPLPSPSFVAAAAAAVAAAAGAGAAAASCPFTVVHAHSRHCTLWRSVGAEL